MPSHKKKHGNNSNEGSSSGNNLNNNNGGRLARTDTDTSFTMAKKPAKSPSPKPAAAKKSHQQQQQQQQSKAAAVGRKPAPVQSGCIPPPPQQKSASSDYAETLQRLMEAPIIELSFALAVRIFTKKRVLATILLILVALAQVHQDELMDMMPATSAGLHVEEDSRPGLLFDKSKIKHRHPVVLIPGFITTGLEIWRGKPCIMSSSFINFRSRVFSGPMLLKLFRDPACYLEHLSLDNETADDPSPEIAIRNDIGFDSLDYFQPGFWVWAKAQVNLREELSYIITLRGMQWHRVEQKRNYVGYLPTSLYAAPYDWRLDHESLERRDRYFTRLRMKIEGIVDSKRHDIGAVLLAHSYGSMVLNRFLNWVDKIEPGWADKHIHAVVHIAGTHMGVTKSVGALLSGEVKDTAMMPSVARRLLDSHMIRRSRAATMRTWPCLTEMLPRGPPGAFPQLLQWTHNNTNLTLTETMELIRRVAVQTNSTRLARIIEETHKTGERYEVPTVPRSKKMKIFCLYGVGQDTESAYQYSPPESEDDLASLGMDLENTTGVIFGDGDATVPLASLGYACRSRHGFKKNVDHVVTVELPHNPAPAYLDPRGGPETSDHVDILGSYPMLESILKIATGRGDEVTDVIKSDIDAITARLDKEYDAYLLNKNKKK